MSKNLEKSTPKTELEKRIKRLSLALRQATDTVEKLSKSSASKPRPESPAISDEEKNRQEEIKQNKKRIKEIEEEIKASLARQESERKAHAQKRKKIDAILAATKDEAGQSQSKRKLRLSKNLRGLELAGLDNKQRRPLRTSADFGDLPPEVTARPKFPFDLPSADKTRKRKEIPTYAAEWRRHKTVSSVVVMASILSLVGIVMMASAGSLVAGSDAASAADMIQNFTQLKWGAVLLSIAVVVMILAIFLRKPSPRADRWFAGCVGRTRRAMDMTILTTGLDDRRKPQTPMAVVDNDSF